MNRLVPGLLLRVDLPAEELADALADALAEALVGALADAPADALADWPEDGLEDGLGDALAPALALEEAVADALLGPLLGALLGGETTVVLCAAAGWGSLKASHDTRKATPEPTTSAETASKVKIRLTACSSPILRLGAFYTCGS